MPIDYPNSNIGSSEKGAYFSCSEEEDDDVYEHKVTDVSFKVFYSPHRLLAMAITFSWILYQVVVHLFYAHTQADSFYRGFVCCGGLIAIFGAIVLPNGPFIRPHPILWRILLGLSFFYLLLITFCLFLTYDTIRGMLFYLDPILRTHRLELDNYATDCRFKWSVISERIDIFVFLHFIGWLGKAFVIRHTAILWFFSIMWELSEVYFQHLLPNFKECWWDCILLDTIICNGLGIFAGQYILNKLRYNEYHWESVKKITSTSGKIKRCILQFAPLKMDSYSIFKTDSIFKRVIELSIFSAIWQLSELNTFFLKHIFIVNTSHWLNSVRCTLLIILALPTTRQYYEYITNPRVHKLGIFCWTFMVITSVELLLVVKNGLDLFAKTKVIRVMQWMVTQFVLTIIFLIIGIYCKNRTFELRKARKKQKTN